MIHAVNITNGKATYVARFVRTARLQQEEYYGAAKFMKVYELVISRLVLSINVV